MGKIFIKIFEAIKLYSGYYFTLTAAIGVLWGAFVVFDNWKDNNVLMQSNVAKIIDTQKKQSETDSVILYNQSIIEAQISEIKLTNQVNSQHLKSLSTSYIKYLSKDKTLTKDDFLNYMEGLRYEVKKNSTTYPTPTER